MMLRVRGQYPVGKEGTLYVSCTQYRLWRLLESYLHLVSVLPLI